MGEKEIVKLKVPNLEKRTSYENSDEFKKMEQEVDKLASEETKRFKGKLGYCHLYWSAKQRLFKELYNIDWQTPAQRNPHIIFD